MIVDRDASNKAWLKRVDDENITGRYKGMVICKKCGREIEISHGYQIGGTDEYGQKNADVQHINCLVPLTRAKLGKPDRGPVKFEATGP